MADLTNSNSVMTDIARALFTYEVERHRHDFTGLSHVSPITHMGGKGKVCEELAALVPSLDGRTFVDVFGGAASVPLKVAAQQKMGGVRVHDTHEPLIVFWTVLRDAPEALVAAIRALVEPHWSSLGHPDPASIEAMAAHVVDVLNANQGTVRDRVALAAAYYLHVHCCNPATQFAPTASSIGWGKMKSFHSGLARRLGQLFRWSAAIQGWEFAKCDFRESLADAARLGDRAFVFADPPYEETDHCYGCHFPASYHDELAETLRNVAEAGGQFMVTTNWSETNCRRYAGFTQLIRTQVYNSKGAECGKELGVELVILSHAAAHLEGLRQQFCWMTVEEGRAWMAAQTARKLEKKVRAA